MKYPAFFRDLFGKQSVPRLNRGLHPKFHGDFLEIVSPRSRSLFHSCDDDSSNADRVKRLREFLKKHDVDPSFARFTDDHEPLVRYSHSMELAKYFVEELHLDMNATNVYGRTVLHTAGRNEDDMAEIDIQVCLYLMDHGCSVNLVNREGSTCIVGLFFNAVYHKNLNALKTLFDRHGCDINIHENYYGEDSAHPNIEMSLFVYAVYTGDLDIVRYLVREHGADVNKIAHKDNHPPVIVAIIRERYRTTQEQADMVSYLVDAGADLTVTNSEDGKPVFNRILLHLADGESFENNDLVKNIMQKYNIEGDGVRAYLTQRTLLITAVDYSNVDLAKFLIEDRKATVDCRSNGGETVLHYTADVRMLEYLCTQGADTSWVDKEQNTGLMHLFKYGCYGLQEELLLLFSWYAREKGVDFEFKNRQGRTLVDILESNVENDIGDRSSQEKILACIGLIQGAVAASQEGLETLRAFVRTNPDLDRLARDRNGNTWFLQACRAGDLNVAQFWHADVQAWSDAQAAMLYAINKNGETALHLAAQSGNLNLIQWLVGRGREGWIHELGKHGDTVLHAACRAGSMEIVPYLVGRGLDMLRQNHLGVSPFEQAFNFGHFDVLVWYNVSPQGVRQFMQLADV